MSILEDVYRDEIPPNGTCASWCTKQGEHMKPWCCTRVLTLAEAAEFRGTLRDKQGEKMVEMARKVARQRGR